MEVKAGTLVFSVLIFSICAFICLSLLSLRRRAFGGELGGPFGPKILSGVFLFLLWGFFIGLSSWRAVKGDGVTLGEQVAAILVGVAILILSTGVLATLASYCGGGQETSSSEKTEQSEEQGFKVNFGGASAKNLNPNFLATPNFAVNNVGITPRGMNNWDGSNQKSMMAMNTSPSRFARSRSGQQPIPSSGDVQAQLSQFSQMLSGMQEYIANLQAAMSGQNNGNNLSSINPMGSINPNALSPANIGGRSLRGALSPNPGSKQSNVGNSPCPPSGRRFGSTISGDAQSTMSNDLSLANNAGNNAGNMGGNVNGTDAGRESPEKDGAGAAESPDASTHCSSPDI